VTEALPPITDNPPRSDLASRTIVGVLLIAVALACLSLGGWVFALLVLAGVSLVWGEWCLMHRIDGALRVTGHIALLATIIPLFGRESTSGDAGQALSGHSPPIPLPWGEVESGVARPGEGVRSMTSNSVPPHPARR